MLTAIDTNVLSDVFRRDPQHYEQSAANLRLALNEGAVVACEVVWAEISAAFAANTDAENAMDQLRIDYDALDLPACLRCGETWRRYRKAGGSRTRLIADFMIASHAIHRADRLLTRDRGFYRTYFPDLVLMDPGPEPTGRGRQEFE
ncbi:MAG: type II toxin-antitoxin system VapC family toxin [Actinomycetota bacterium]